MKKANLLCLMLTSGSVASAAASAPVQMDSISIMAPATPGGGWDSLARTLADTLKATGLVNKVEVYNVPGKAGTVGLEEFVKKHAGPNQLMITGYSMIGGIIVNQAPYNLSVSVTPLARLVSSDEVLIVPAASKYANLDDFLKAFKANPKSIRLGGGSVGGNSHIAFAQLAQELGLSSSSIQYVPSAGGGQATKAMLNGELDAVTAGYDDDLIALLKAGKVRVLAAMSDTAIAGLDAPTLMSKGINVDGSTWRGVVATGNLKVGERLALVRLIDSLVRTPEWKAALAQNRWRSSYMNSARFTTFLSNEQINQKRILLDLGLAK